MSDFSVFPNGTSFMCWRDQNCDRCRKDFVDTPKGNGENPLCSLETEISLASVLDGRIQPEARAEFSRRMKWDGHTYLGHDCPEFEPIPKA